MNMCIFVCYHASSQPNHNFGKTIKKLVWAISFTFELRLSLSPHRIRNWLGYFQQYRIEGAITEYSIQNSFVAQFLYYSAFIHEVDINRCLALCKPAMSTGTIQKWEIWLYRSWGPLLRPTHLFLLSLELSCETLSRRTLPKTTAYETTKKADREQWISERQRWKRVDDMWINLLAFCLSMTLCNIRKLWSKIVKAD